MKAAKHAGCEAGDCAKDVLLRKTTRKKTSSPAPFRQSSERDRERRDKLSDMAKHVFCVRMRGVRRGPSFLHASFRECLRCL